MRLALFETSGEQCAVELDKVLHVLTAPEIFRLPLLKNIFTGGFLYQGQVVPLLSASAVEAAQGDIMTQAGFVLVCEAEFGLLGVPADKIIRITRSEESGQGEAVGDLHGESYEINGCTYRQLDLNAVLDNPEFSMCGLKD